MISWECKLFIKWCNTGAANSAGDLTAWAEQKYYLHSFHICLYSCAQILEHCWRIFGDRMCDFIGSPALILLASCLFLCFPNHQGSVGFLLIPVFWQCPHSGFERMLTENSCLCLSKKFGAMETEEQTEVVGAEASLPFDMWFRVYFKPGCVRSSSWWYLLGLWFRAVCEPSECMVKGNSKGNLHENSQCCSRLEGMHSQRVSFDLCCGIRGAC